MVEESIKTEQRKKQKIEKTHEIISKFRSEKLMQKEMEAKEQELKNLEIELSRKKHIEVS